MNEENPKEKNSFFTGLFYKGKEKYDISFFVLTLIVLVIGLFMMFSASYANAYYYEHNAYHYIIRQGIFAVVGIIAMMIISKIDYHILHKFAWPLYIFSAVLLLLVYIMPTINYAHRWIIIGGFTLQASEVAKFSLTLLYSDIISKSHDKMDDLKHTVLPLVSLLMIYAVLIVFEPHVSATILICSMAAFLLFLGGVPIKWFGVLAGGGIVTAGALMLVPAISSRVMARLNIWFDPFKDYDAGFQTIQSLYAIGSGGLLGTGIGQSRQKYLFLPEPQNDFVFAIGCEELGFVGAILIIALFALLVIQGFRIAMHSKDRFGMLLAAGLTFQVGLQAVLNFAVVTNTIPNTGISLPFFSYGGTSLLMLLAQMGVILSISRQCKFQETGETRK